MSKILADHNKNREHTHKVTVEFTLPASSVKHAEEVIKNAINSGFYNAEVIDSNMLQ